MVQNQNFEFQLSSLTQLNVIDKLRELGVGDFVALPQVRISDIHHQNLANKYD
jgi:hypothetical protein